MTPAHERFAAENGHGLSFGIDGIAAVIDSFIDALTRSRRFFYSAYSVAFVLFFFLFSYSLWRAGLSFIWVDDGAEQQYNFFILESNWLHELLQNVFVNHTFAIPMWTDTVGYGADYVLSACNMLGNPINLLAVFAVPETAEFWLSLTVPITLFIAGLTFISYCNYHLLDRPSILVACFVYLFSGYSAIVVNQIHMLYPLIVAPITFLGFDKILDRQSPAQLIVGVALMGLYSVNQAYMLCLILAVYGLVRFVFLPRSERNLKRFMTMLLSVLVPVLLGLIVSFILFLPMCSNILGQNRLSVERDQSLLYPAHYYFQLIAGFITNTDVGSECKYGFAPIAVLCLALSAKDKDINSRVMKLMIAVSIVVLCIPFLGRVTNGFAYPNNRWVWAFSFFMGVVTAITLPKVWERGISRRFLIGTAIVILVSMALIPATKSTQGAFFAALCILMSTIVLLYFCEKHRAGVFAAALLSLVLWVAMVFYVNGALFVAATSHSVPIGKAYSSVVEDTGLSMVQNMADSSEYRTDTLGVQVKRNSNIAAGILGDTFYNSFYNSRIDEYHTSLGLSSSTLNFSYAGFNSRSVMEALSGTKYMIVSEGRRASLSPLFDHLIGSKESGGSAQYLYETSHCLPLAYFAAGTLDRSTYNSNNFVNRQNLLLSNIVLEDGDYEASDKIASLSPSDISDYSTELSYTCSTSYQGPENVPGQIEGAESSIQFSDNSIVTTVPNSVVYLDVDIPSNTEAYVILDHLNFTNQDGESGQAAYCHVYADGTSSGIWNAGYQDTLYGGKDSWCVNTGYSSKDRHVIALQFQDAGTYEFSDLKVVSENVDWIPDKIDELASNGVTDAVLQGNLFSCTANSDKGGLVYIRIPYAEGWHAQVNGEDVDIERANIAFMAIEVGAGENDIVLTYTSPYVVKGAQLSLLGIALSVVYCFVMKKHGNRRNKTGVISR